MKHRLLVDGFLMDFIAPRLPTETHEREKKEEHYHQSLLCSPTRVAAMIYMVS